MLFICAHIDTEIIIDFEFSHVRGQNFLIAFIDKLHIRERRLIHSQISEFLTALERLLCRELHFFGRAPTKRCLLVNLKCNIDRLQVMLLLELLIQLSRRQYVLLYMFICTALFMSLQFQLFGRVISRD